MDIQGVDSPAIADEVPVAKPETHASGGRKEPTEAEKKNSLQAQKMVQQFLYSSELGQFLERFLMGDQVSKKFTPEHLNTVFDNIADRCAEKLNGQSLTPENLTAVLKATCEDMRGNGQLEYANVGEWANFMREIPGIVEKVFAENKDHAPTLKTFVDAVRDQRMSETVGYRPVEQASDLADRIPANEHVSYGAPKTISIDSEEGAAEMRKIFASGTLGLSSMDENGHYSMIENDMGVNGAMKHLGKTTELRAVFNVDSSGQQHLAGFFLGKEQGYYMPVEMIADKALRAEMGRAPVELAAAGPEAMPVSPQAARQIETPHAAPLPGGS